MCFYSLFVFFSCFCCRRCCFYFWLHVSSLRRKWTNKSIHTHKKICVFLYGGERNIDEYICRTCLSCRSNYYSSFVLNNNRTSTSNAMNGDEMKLVSCHVMSCLGMSFNFSTSYFRIRSTKFEKKMKQIERHSIFRKIVEHQRFRISSIDTAKKSVLLNRTHQWQINWITATW